jgi:hypothetical protein
LKKVLGRGKGCWCFIFIVRDAKNIYLVNFTKEIFYVVAARNYLSILKAILRNGEKSEMDDREYYFIMDLERTIKAGVPCYWLGNKQGYTFRIEQAGIFPEEKANEIISQDYDHRTVKLSLTAIERILKRP